MNESKKLFGFVFRSAAMVVSAAAAMGFWPGILRAQTIDDILPDFTPEEAASIGKAFGTYTSAVTVFTGRNAASTGNFSFDNDGGDFSVTSVPFSHTFGSDGDTARFRLRGGVGRFSAKTSFAGFAALYEEIEAELPPELQGLPNQADFRKDTATSLTLGGSVVFEPAPGLLIEPAFDLIWTHVKRRYDYNNLVSALVAIKFDRDLFNHSTEALTYSPSLGVSYEHQLGDGYTLTPSVLYTHLWSEDLWSKSKFANFSIDSGILRTALAANIPLPYTAFGADLSVQPFVVWTNLNGAVRKSLDEDNLYEVGTDIAFWPSDAWLSQVRLGAAYITASDLWGYRVNLGADF